MHIAVALVALLLAMPLNGQADEVWQEARSGSRTFEVGIREGQGYVLRTTVPTPPDADRRSVLRARQRSEMWLIAEVCKIGSGSTSCTIQYAAPRLSGTHMEISLLHILVNGERITPAEIQAYLAQ